MPPGKVQKYSHFYNRCLRNQFSLENLTVQGNITEQSIKKMFRSTSKLPWKYKTLKTFSPLGAHAN